MHKKNILLNRFNAAYIVTFQRAFENGHDFVLISDVVHSFWTAVEIKTKVITG